MREKDRVKCSIHWEKEADVVVVGYGGTGAVSAITVSELGGSVIILEKAPEAGGSTSTCAGGMRVPDNGEKATQYINAVSLGSIDEEIAAAYAKTWMEMVPWIKRYGAEVVLWNVMPSGTFPKRPLL